MTIPRSAPSFCPLIQCLHLTVPFRTSLYAPLPPARFTLLFKLLLYALFLHSYSVPSIGSPFSRFQYKPSFLRTPYCRSLLAFLFHVQFSRLSRTRDRVVITCAREPAQRAARCPGGSNSLSF